MLQMVESAVEKKTKTENFISVFAKYYTPIVVLAAVIISVSYTHLDVYKRQLQVLSDLLSASEHMP